MVKAEPAPCAWPIGRTPYTFRRCAEFPVFFATGNGTRRLPPFHASMEAAVPLSCFGWIASQNNPMRDKTRLKMNRKGYIGTMTQLPKGPVASEIEQRLQSALSPVHLAVINDRSEEHTYELQTLMRIPYAVLGMK